jgi:hypothetical protein
VWRRLAHVGSKLFNIPGTLQHENDAGAADEQVSATRYYLGKSLHLRQLTHRSGWGEFSRSVRVAFRRLKRLVPMFRN